MKTIIWVATVMFLLFALMFFWANWNPPSLSARYHPGPVATVLYRAGGAVQHTDSTRIQQRLRMLKGVTAVSINNQSALLCIAYNDQLLSVHVFDTLLQRCQPRYRLVQLSDYHGPVCPMPIGWLNRISRIKQWLSFRS